MKITKLTTFVVPPRWLFLKIETDEGITGWGEPVVEGRAGTVAAWSPSWPITSSARTPRRSKTIGPCFTGGGFYRGGAVHMSALAGIDQALWDIKGKALGAAGPCLLGGPVRQKMRVYSWIGGDRPERLIARRQGSASARLLRHQDELATEELALSRQPRQLDAVVARRAARFGTRWDRISASRWISTAACIGRWRNSWRRSSIPSI